MNKEEYYEILKTDYVGSDDQYKFVINNLKDGIPFAYARFNDGEMMGIDKIGSVVARGDQHVNEELHTSLIDAIKYTQLNYYVGIPCEICFPYYNKLANELVGDYDYKVSAVALTNRNWAKFISELGDVMVGKDVRFISGDDQDLTFLEKNLNFNIINHTKLTSKNSWGEIEKLTNYISDVKGGEVVFISLGPSSRILVRKWFEINPNATYIDIGSILDPFTRNVWYNCHMGWQNGFNMTKKCNSCN